MNVVSMLYDKLYECRINVLLFKLSLCKQTLAFLYQMIAGFVYKSTSNLPSFTGGTTFEEQLENLGGQRDPHMRNSI